MHTLTRTLSQTQVSEDLAPLLRAAREGDQEAFGQLLARFGGGIYEIARGMLGDRAEAEDVYQEVFLQFLRCLPRLNARKGVGAWLRRVAVNRCCDVLRRRRSRPEVGPVDETFHCGANGTGSDWERRQWLRSHLSALSPRERAAVLLVYQLGYSTAECGRALGCAPGTVKSLCYKARRKLAAVHERESRGERSGDHVRTD